MIMPMHLLHSLSLILMHGFVSSFTAFGPCRFRPGRFGSAALLQYDRSVLESLQAAYPTWDPDWQQKPQ